MRNKESQNEQLTMLDFLHAPKDQRKPKKEIKKKSTVVIENGVIVPRISGSIVR